MTKQSNAIDPATIKPDDNYQITLARPASVGGIKLPPRGEIKLRGDLLKTLLQETPDVVLSATSVA